MLNLRQINIFNNKGLKRDSMEQIILSSIIELNKLIIFLIKINKNNFNIWKKLLAKININKILLMFICSTIINNNINTIEN